MDQTQHWYGNPNVEYVFLNDGGLTTYSFDFHYDFTKAASYTLWAGGGPTLIHRDFDAAAPAENVDSTDPGVNLLFGVGGTEGKVRPYGQFKVIVADDPAVLVAEEAARLGVEVVDDALAAPDRAGQGDRLVVEGGRPAARVGDRVRLGSQSCSAPPQPHAKANATMPAYDVDRFIWCLPADDDNHC
jgi:hypothetical protein